jgi:hypothetical protein
MSFVVPARGEEAMLDKQRRELITLLALIWAFSAAGNALIGNKQGQEGRIA